MKPYLRYTFKLVWQQKNRFIFLLVLMILATAMRLVQPYLFKIIVDTLSAGLTKAGFTQDQVSLLWKVVLIWFGLSVLNNVVQPQTSFLAWEIGNKNSQIVHMEGFKRLLRLDYQSHTRKHSSRYAKIVDEADTSMWEMSVWWLNRIIPSLVGFVGMLVIALNINWQMTLLSLVVIPPGLALVLLMIKRNEDEQHRINKLWSAKHEHLSDQVSNIITYKLNQDEPLFMGVQQEFSDNAANAQMALNKKWRLADMLNPDIIARFLVMGVGVLYVKEGQITLGTLFMFMGLLNEILVPLHLLGDILPQYSRRARHIEKLLQLIDQKDQIIDPVKPDQIHEIQGKVEFRDVSFAYNTDEKEEHRVYILKNLSFTIEPGEHAALVGHSGAGKSTIMALLTRLVDPTSGEILVDGVNIKKFRQSDYRKFIGTVLQEHSLYSETIAQNIAYGKPNALREEIIAAAKRAAADAFIQKLPEGYDTMIGERGVRLSGGEKQRISIARAVLKNPRIVVLDEPTSALDSITEAKVQKGLDCLIEGRTALVIAHRLATVRNSDNILLLNDGKFLAKGSHMELLRNCAEYAEMVQLQTGGFLADK